MGPRPENSTQKSGEPPADDPGPRGGKAQSSRPRASAAETRQWLEIPPPVEPRSDNGNGAGGKPARTRRNPRGLRRFIPVSRPGRPDVDRRRTASDIKTLELEVNELCSYIERLEASAPRPSGRSEPKEKLDLNRATFEDLRQIGIPVILSARLIAHRHVREGYHGLGELTEVPGISAEVVSVLKAKVRI